MDSPLLWIIGIGILYRVLIHEQLFGCGPLYRKIGKFPDYAYDLFSKDPRWYFADSAKDKKDLSGASFYVPKLDSKKVKTFFVGTDEERDKSEKLLFESLVEIEKQIKTISADYSTYTKIFLLNSTDYSQMSDESAIQSHMASMFDDKEKEAWLKKTQRQDDALKGIIKLSLSNPFNKDVILKYKVDEQKLKDVFIQLEKQNAGFVVDNHYLSLACITFPETLEFLFSNYPFDYSEGVDISKRLWDYFKRKRVGEI
jgi:hypothetical protein